MNKINIFATFLSTFFGVLAQIQTYQYRYNRNLTKVEGYIKDIPSWAVYFIVWFVIYTSTISIQKLF